MAWLRHAALTRLVGVDEMRRVVQLLPLEQLQILKLQTGHAYDRRILRNAWTADPYMLRRRTRIALFRISKGT